MADGASLERFPERFLDAVARLRAGAGFDPVRSFQLPSASGFDGGDALGPPLDEALRVGAAAPPTARNNAVARCALGRIAIAVERRLPSTMPVQREPLRRTRM